MCGEWPLPVFAGRAVAAIRRSSYLSGDVTPPTRRDLLSVLELARDVTAAEASDPFPLDLLRRLGELVGVEVVGYCESPLPAGFGAYELVTRPQPAWLAEALERSGGEDPVHARAWNGAVEPVAISDLLSARAFHRLHVYEDICEPQIGRAHV